MAAKLPDLNIPLPKRVATAAKASTLPTTNAGNGEQISRSSAYSLLNNSVANYRNASNVTQLIRHFCRAEGSISSALHSLVQVANNTFTITAFDAKTHEFSVEGTKVAAAIRASFETLYDFNAGFSTKKSFESLNAHLIREAAITGAVAAELVINKAFVPDNISVVPFESLRPMSNGKGSYYYDQLVAGGDDIPLNIPNFFVSFVQSDAGQPFAISMFESAIKLLLMFEEFLEDIRRSIKVSGHSRTMVTLDSGKVVSTAPANIKEDPAKLKLYMEQVRDAVAAQLQSLTPEQALVMFDYAEVEVLNSGLGTKVDYTPLLSVISGLYATSMKTPPSAIGLRLEGGSQALGNVESLIFLKAAAALQTPIEEVYSRMLTLGCRVLGSDVYVEFKFDTINLRPADELEAFKTMKQTRILELLSLGLYSDDYAAHLLGTGFRPAGAPVLSGTMFHSGDGNQVSSFPGDTAMGRTLQPDKEVPRKGGGKSQ
jgi:hypothetical protein